MGFLAGAVTVIIHKQMVLTTSRNTSVKWILSINCSNDISSTDLGFPISQSVVFWIRNPICVNYCMGFLAGAVTVIIHKQSTHQGELICAGFQIT